jgi:hypothetical protein
MRTAVAIFSVFLALGIGACSDDDTPAPDFGTDGQAVDVGPQDDATTTEDGTPGTSDQGTNDQAASDVGEATDLPASNLNCAQITTCSQNCVAGCPNDATKLQCFIKCSNDCKARGCDGAKAPYDAVYTCIGAKCTMECAAGGTPECKTCTETKCADAWATCTAQTCP